MQTVTVTRRNRNLGYAWTNQPAQRRNSRGEGILVLEAPDAPQVKGGPATVRAEARRARRLNAGNDWTSAVFVGGRCVVAVNGLSGWATTDFFEALERGAPFAVTLAGPDEVA